MAYQTQSLAAAEHDWFFSQLSAQGGGSVAPNTPLNEVKQRFYRFWAGGSSHPTSLVELERRFLQTQTSLTGEQSLHNLWSAYAGMVGINATGKTLDQIKYEFYIQNTI